MPMLDARALRRKSITPTLSRSETPAQLGSVPLSAGDDQRTNLSRITTSFNPKYGDGIKWKLKQDVDFLRDA
jgi:hypothetical protein